MTEFEVFLLWKIKKTRKRVILVMLIVLLLVGNLGSFTSTTADQQHKGILYERISQIPPVKKVGNEKLEWSVFSLLKNSEAFGEVNEKQKKPFVFIGEKVQLELVLSDLGDIDRLRSFDNSIEVEMSYGYLAQILTPVDKIELLAKQSFVEYIQKPVEAYPIITSEGVGVINADDLHDLGYYGDGVKVAIIDLGFTGYTSNPEIPLERVKEVKSFCSDNEVEVNKHGTACAEIVLDVAPDADLYLYVVSTDVEFCNALDYAVSQGVDVISISLGVFNANDLDGRGVICEAVNDARDAGVLVCVSSGNYAQRHYCGWYVDNDSDNYHDFDTGNNFLSLGYIPAGRPIDLYLSWNDWPYSDQDYDLYLYDSDGYLIDYSINPQDGSQPPTEELDVSAPWSDYYYVYIHNYSASSSVRFQLFSYSRDFKDNVHPETSITCPSDASGAMTTGATHWQSDNLESFSSRGPTNDGRIKPDITAPDGVSTYTYGTEGFYGTSASSPHLAGSAALIKSVDYTLTADQLQTVLETTAVDKGESGKDNLYGSGRIDVWKAYNSPVVNKPPVANDDYYSTNEDTILTINTPGVLENDTDANNDTLSAVLVNNPSQGELIFNSNGSFTYTPDQDYYGTDSFTYKANDNKTDSNIATVYINITPVNDPPVAVDDETTTDEDTPVLIDVLSNDYDIDGTINTIGVAITQIPSHGNVTVDVNGTVTYTPLFNYYGVDSFKYKVKDDDETWSNDAQVNITINEVNDAPVANDDYYSTNEDTILTINTPGVLENDTDWDGDNLTVFLVNNPNHGTLILNSNGSFTYTPDQDYYGTDSFTYKANDSKTDSNIATVYITINEVNDAPTANFSYTPLNPIVEDEIHI